MSTRQSPRVRKPTEAAKNLAAESASAPKKKPVSTRPKRASAGKKAVPPPADRKILALFDVDGTLTAARKEITKEMTEFMSELRQHVVVGVVGGSDLPKQREQVSENVTDEYDYSFSENGLVAYEEGKLIHTKSMRDELGEDKLKEFINFCLKYLSEMDCPVKRGTFIEYRTGMLNISPVGRQCSLEERDAFEKYDLEHKLRETFCQVLDKEFGERFKLKFSIGGQISFDVFPRGWDKTYCLQFVENKGYDEIHFFGDKTFAGGNDYEIFSDPRVKGHTVTSWMDTMQQCKDLFLSDKKEEKDGEEEKKDDGEEPAAKKAKEEEEAKGE
ncbi:hypothetical protein BASA81_000827 [Batrachochytrium salamandrivorans]|nr:hypothetical protein BASA81_000827 [Batrachochytrium salamandrivorans]